jgi:putative zinc- or iron-chelating protein
MIRIKTAWESSQPGRNSIGGFATLPVQTANAVPLYFAFPDGVYQYVCAECDALCCKGDGFGGSLKRELRSLFVLYPQVESMAVSRVGDTVSFANSKGGCQFLDADNRCRIEKEHGKPLKPTVCSLFPFNSFSRIGKTVAVSPHFLCPLRLSLPPRPGEVEGTHANLEAGLRDGEVLSREYVSTMVTPLRLHPSADAVTAVRREETFRDLCSRSLGCRSFSDTLRAASENGAGLDDFVARVARLMKIDAPTQSRPRDRLDDRLLAIAPPHRLSMLALTSEQIVRALAVAELALRRTSSLSELPLSLQGTMRMASSFAPAQRLLAHGNEPVAFAKHISRKDLAFRDPQLTFAWYIFQRQAAGPAGVLGALEAAIPGDMSVSDRSVLLQTLGTLVDQRRSKTEKQRTS